MARTGYAADTEIQGYLFHDVDLDLYSAAQVTDIVAADFIRMADEDAAFYLGAPGSGPEGPDEGLSHPHQDEETLDLRRAA